MYQPFVHVDAVIEFGEKVILAENSLAYNDCLENEKNKAVAAGRQLPLDYKSCMEKLSPSILEDINNFEANTSSCFMKDFDMPGTWYRGLVKDSDGKEKIAFKEVILKKKVNGMNTVIDEPIVANVTNVVAILFYFDSQTDDLFVANTVHLEDGTYGFPSYHEGPPGGHIEKGSTALGTALTESFEEMGRKMHVTPGDIYTGYIVHGVTQYMFIKHNDPYTIMQLVNSKPMYSTCYFEPFTVKVVRDNDLLLKTVDQIVDTTKMTEWEKAYSDKRKSLCDSVLVPRAVGRFDYHSYSYAKADLDSEFIVNNIPGRFGSWTRGFPVYEGLVLSLFKSKTA